MRRLLVADEVKDRMTGPEQVGVGQEETKTLHSSPCEATEEIGSVVKRKKKPFEFRKRLWHMPPEGRDLVNDYSFYEAFDAFHN